MFPTAPDRAELDLVAIPPAVVALLQSEAASPRLVAHLILVHDVSLRLLRRLKKAWPQLRVDVDAVAFGAATHDVGKARHPQELSKPGTLHAAAGERLLLEHGTPPPLARFARTHGAWQEVSLPLEDLLVVVADTAWKARRTKGLDAAVTAAISTQARLPAWDVFMQLDAILSDLAGAADERLEWQGRFSASSPASR